MRNSFGPAKSFMEQVAPYLVGRYTNLGYAELVWDGWHRKFIATVKAVTLGPYKCRVISVLSYGRNHKLDSEYNKDTGTWKFKGDDLGIMVDGCHIEAMKYIYTGGIARQLASILQAMQLSLYGSDPYRDITVDYFVNKRPDGTLEAVGSLNNTCTITDGKVGQEGSISKDFSSDQCWVYADSKELGLLKRFNLTTRDILTAWATLDVPNIEKINLPIFKLMVSNWGTVTKNPGNGDSPPYTMAIGWIAPWGHLFVRQVVEVF